MKVAICFGMASNDPTLIFEQILCIHCFFIKLLAKEAKQNLKKNDFQN